MVRHAAANLIAVMSLLDFTYYALQNSSFVMSKRPLSVMHILNYEPISTSMRYVSSGHFFVSLQPP